MKSLSVTTQMKATEWYIPVVLFILLYEVDLTFEFLSVTIHMKTTEQYFPVVPSIMLQEVVLTFQSVAKILKCDHLNDSY